MFKLTDEQANNTKLKLAHNETLDFKSAVFCYMHFLPQTQAHNVGSETKARLSFLI